MAITYLSGNRIQGLSTDIVDTVQTYQNNFGSAITSEVASYIHVTGGEMHHNVLRGTSRTGYQTLPSTVSANWIMTVKVRIPNRSVAQNNTAYFYLSSSTVNQDSDAPNPTGNAIGFYVNMRTSGEPPAHGAIVVSGGDSHCYSIVQQQNSFQFSNGNTSYTKWIKVVKNGNTVTLTVHDSQSDADNSILTSGSNSSSFTNSTVGAFSNLIYAKWFNVVGQSATAASIYYDDLIISSINSKPTNVPDNSRFEETDTRKIFYYDGSIVVSPDGLGSAADGTPYNGVTQNAAGKIGSYAFNFDGTDDYLSLPLSSSINWNTENWSFSIWFNPTTKNSNHEPLIQKGNSLANNNYDWRLYWGSSDPDKRLWFEGSSTGISSGSNYLTLGNWNHVVVTKSGSGSSSTGKIYLNGVEVGSGTIGTINNSYSDIHLMRANIGNAGQAYSDGKLDDFAFFNRVLSASDVVNLYNSGTGRSIPDAISAGVSNVGLKAYYNFEQTSGNLTNKAKSSAWSQVT